jgi:RNA recognition motif-containing protein
VSPKSESQMSSRLYVGNLSFHSTSETVREAFAQHGTVSDVHLVTDRQTGQSRGFAFVTMGDDAQAATAMAAMNGAMLDGRPLRVNEAESRPQRGGSGGGGGGGGDRRDRRGGGGRW